METREYQIRDPFAGDLTIEGHTLEAAIELAYEDIPVEERPAYVWHDGRRVAVPDGKCRPTG